MGNNSQDALNQVGHTGKLPRNYDITQSKYMFPIMKISLIRNNANR